MENTVWGVALTIFMPFAVLGLAAGIRKSGAGVEASRKLVHILLSNWILLALSVYSNAWACVIPACFIVLNYLSFRKGIFSAIERDEDNTLGTVWYAVSLFLLCIVGYSINLPWFAACGMLAMGYGDGLGALVGKKWGKLHFPGAQCQKSLEGTLAVMLFSGLAVGIVCAAYSHNSEPYFSLHVALSCAVPAAAIELFSPRGIDNLTLPLGVAAIVFVIARYPMVWSVFVALSISLLILIIAYCLRAISVWALYVAALLGVLIYIFGGWLSFGALILFFILGSAVSMIGKGKKSAITALHEHQGARTIPQVLANGLPALIFSAAYFFTGREAFLLAVIACFASNNADTFSSEIGMLSNKRPVSILTLKKMQHGMSGGVTLLGLCGAVLGAAAISVFALFKFSIAGMIVVIAAGLLDSVLDSVLGELFQAKYQMSEKGNEQQLTERREVDGISLKLVKGMSWVNNDVVNFVSVFICGGIVAIIWQA